MKTTAILIVVGVVLIVCIAPLFVRGVDVFRPVLDGKGQQVYGADGRLKLEIDPVGQFMVNWDAHAIMAICGLFILYGIGRTLLHRRTRESGT